MATNNPTMISTGNSTSVNTSQSTSAKKIATYSQSISSTVTNLLTELGRVSASTSGPASSNDGAILLQLQAMTAQMEAMNNRLEQTHSLAQDLDKRFDGVHRRFDGITNRLNSVENGLNFRLEPVTLFVTEQKIRSDQPDQMHNLAQGMDKRFEQVHRRLDGITNRLDTTGNQLKELNPRFEKLDLLATEQKNQNTLPEKMHNLVQGLDKRFEAVHRRLDGITSRLDVTGKDLNTRLEPLDMIAAEEHNKRARLKNKEAKRGHSVLVPLHDSNNKPIPGFPPTLGHLAFLRDKPEFDSIIEVFGLKKEGLGKLGEHQALVEFLGFNFIHIDSIFGNYVLPEVLEERRTRRKEARDLECRSVGPPTSKSIAAAAKHNQRARAHNRKANIYSFILMPLYDSRNIPVYGFPKTVSGVGNGLYTADILYFLGEYGQSTEEKGCFDRFVEFLGLSMEVVLDSVDSNQF